MQRLLLFDATGYASGTYKPGNYGAGDSWPAPAPASSGNQLLSIFNGTDPNGTWSLYVHDDAGGDIGSISGGWCIVICTCSITGANSICAGTNGTSFSGLAGMSSYAWSISGNGTISGASNAQSVAVNAGSAGSYTLTLTTTNANGCNSTCSKTVTVTAVNNTLGGTTVARKPVLPSLSLLQEAHIAMPRVIPSPGWCRPALLLSAGLLLLV